MYNLCCKSAKASKLFFRHGVPETLVDLLEEMRNADEQTHYHPQAIEFELWGMHWIRMLALGVQKQNGVVVVDIICTEYLDRMNRLQRAIPTKHNQHAVSSVLLFPTPKGHNKYFDGYRHMSDKHSVVSASTDCKQCSAHQERARGFLNPVTAGTGNTLLPAVQPT